MAAVVTCPYLIPGDGKSSNDRLQVREEYRSCPIEQRVLSCRTYLKRNGDVGYTGYTLDHDRNTLFKRILAIPASNRHYCAVIPDDQPVLFYADLDLKSPP